MGIIVMPFTIGALSTNFDRIPKIWHIFGILFRKVCIIQNFSVTLQPEVAKVTKHGI